MKVLVGSNALAFHGKLKGRNPADWDIITDEPDFKSQPYLEVTFAQPNTSDAEIIAWFKRYEHEWLETPYGKVIVAPLTILKILKLSCVNHLDKQKHQWDLDQLTNVNINTPWLQKILTQREAEVIARVELQKEKFFNKYSIPRYVDHDLLHEYIADNPMYLRILVDSVDVSETKFNALTENEKRDLVREECLVLGLERELIPNIKRAPMLARVMVQQFLKTDTSDTVAMRWLSRMSIEQKIKDHPVFVTKWTQKNIDFIMDGFHEYWQEKNNRLPVEFWEFLLV